ncbi:MAG: preprotein translocase subunit SecE [Oscillospiraceae bacterium]|jgi:preprotein translocase subunit SecE|nr:preprotein translocase subunit SecE [Oscillospiraceae bacterium]
MSEEKERTESPAIEPAAKPPAKKKAKRKNPFAKWYREMRSELKKVVWPTPKQIVNNTGVALAVMAASSIAIWALDFVGSEIFRALISLGGS